MASIGLLRACKWRTGRSSLPSNRGALTHGAGRRFSNPSARGKDGSRHQPHHRESALLNHPRIVPTARRRDDRITTYLAAVHESAYGTKPTCRDESRMSAFGGKADKRHGVALTASVVDDPTAPFAARNFCSAN